MTTVRLGLLGYGRVGQAVATVAAANADRLRACGVDFQIVAALVRDPAKRRSGPAANLCADAAAVFDARPQLLIEVMGGIDPAFDYVRRALEAGTPVVTANKTLMAARGEELRAIARRHRTPLLFDAAVLAGVPFLGALSRRPFLNAPLGITGILNGTSHFICCALARGASLQDALVEARSRGYAEPDSSADLSGRDAAEKLTILAHLAGCADLRVADLTRCDLTVLTPTDFVAARALYAVIKPIAQISFNRLRAGAWIGPALIDASHPHASSAGVFNFVQLDTQAGHDLPVTFSGPGAGPAVTAATILDDAIEAWRGEGHPDRFPAPCAVPARELRQPAPSSWYVRVGSTNLTPIDVAEILAAHRVPAERLVSVEGGLAIRTIGSPWPAVQAISRILEANGADVLVLPVIGAPTHGE